MAERFENDHDKVEIVAIEWHAALHAQDSVDKRSHPTILHAIPRARVLVNEYLGDILYYFTAFHGQWITQHVTNELNRRYGDLCERYPSFGGKTAIMGFSLGGLIAYDIVCAQRPGHALDTSHVKPPPLVFQPQYLFSLGSPVASTLVMRGQTYETYRVPDWCTFQNVYHPCDPLGYRLEPLVNPELAHVAPVHIASHQTHPTYVQKQLIKRASTISLTDVLLGVPSILLGHAASSPPASLGIALYKHSSTLLTSLVDYFWSGRAEQDESSSEEEVEVLSFGPSKRRRQGAQGPNKRRNAEWIDLTEEEEELPTTSDVLACLDKRLDYMVVDDRLSYMNDYLVGIRAHFNYWSNRDVIEHILTCLQDT
jgi:hypothetical protein